MLRKLDHQFMGGAVYDWLESTYHFSYADYFDQANLNFGVLRVLNDNMIAPPVSYTHLSSLTYLNRSKK